MSIQCVTMRRKCPIFVVIVFIGVFYSSLHILVLLLLCHKPKTTIQYNINIFIVYCSEVYKMIMYLSSRRIPVNGFYMHVKYFFNIFWLLPNWLSFLRWCNVQGGNRLVGFALSIIECSHLVCWWDSSQTISPREELAATIYIILLRATLWCSVS